MSSIQPIQSHFSAATRRPQFGAASPTVVLSPWANRVDRVFSKITATRGIELLFIDLVAWNFLRTAMDLFRPFFFKNPDTHKRELNIPAARERVLMESLGALPDAVGIVAMLAGLAFDWGGRGFSRSFASVETLDFFQNLAKEAKVTSEETFIESVAKQLDTTNWQKVAEWLKQGVRDPKQHADEAAIRIAKHLKQEHFDVKLLDNYFALPQLMKDISKLFETVGRKAYQGVWHEQAIQVIKRSVQSNWFRIPAGTAIGLALNIAAPHFIHRFTAKHDNISDFPGEMGLRKMKTEAQADQKPKTFLQKMFPYASQSFKKGNILPLLVSLIPLPLILGLVNPEKIPTAGWKAARNKLGPGYLKRLGSILQYSNHFPYSGAGQMAILYSVVLGGRMMTARNAVEFRERVIDGFLAWITWILATPLLNKKIAQHWDRTAGTQLTKNVGGEVLLKTRGEIEQLIKSPGKTLNKFVWIKPISIVSTILLLGVVEPYLSIRLTEWQSRFLQKKKPSTTPEPLQAKMAPVTVSPKPLAIAPMAMPPLAPLPAAAPMRAYFSPVVAPPVAMYPSQLLPPSPFILTPLQQAAQNIQQK